MLNVEVTKTGTESNSTIIRKFTKKVQESGILRHLRGIRYSLRAPSIYTKKKSALKRMNRKIEIERFLKLGKNPEILKRTR